MGVHHRRGFLNVCHIAFGYNRVTSPQDYRSPHYLLHTLIDIVSKNGNYLLNIGPDGDGIIPQPVVERLLAMGHWLGHSGECIYETVSASTMIATSSVNKIPCLYSKPFIPAPSSSLCGSLARRQPSALSH